MISSSKSKWWKTWFKRFGSSAKRCPNSGAGATLPNVHSEGASGQADVHPTYGDKGSVLKVSQDSDEGNNVGAEPDKTQRRLPGAQRRRNRKQPEGIEKRPDCDEDLTQEPIALLAHARALTQAPLQPVPLSQPAPYFPEHFVRSDCDETEVDEPVSLLQRAPQVTRNAKTSCQLSAAALELTIVFESEDVVPWYEAQKVLTVLVTGLEQASQQAWNAEVPEVESQTNWREVMLKYLKESEGYSDPEAWYESSNQTVWVQLSPTERVRLRHAYPRWSESQAWCWAVEKILDQEYVVARVDSDEEPVSRPENVLEVTGTEVLEATRTDDWWRPEYEDCLSNFYVQGATHSVKNKELTRALLPYEGAFFKRFTKNMVQGLYFGNNWISEELFERVVGKITHAEELQDKPLCIRGLAYCLLTRELPSNHECQQLVNEEGTTCLEYWWAKELTSVLRDFRTVPSSSKNKTIQNKRKSKQSKRR